MIWLLLFPLLTVAQKEVYIYTRLNKSSGLLSNHTRVILQDSRGFVWFGSTSGLQRYDGLNFHTLSLPGHPARNVQEEITAMMEDDQKHLWAVSSSRVYLFDISGKPLRNIPVIRENMVHNMEILEIFMDARKTIWLTTRRHGAFIYIPGTDRFEPAHTRLSFPTNGSVMDVIQDNNASFLWLATENGVLLFDPIRNRTFSREETIRTYPCLGNPSLLHPVLDMMIDSRNRLWVTVWDREKENMLTYMWESAQDTAVSGSWALGEQHALYEDSRRNIWSAGDQFMIYRTNTKKFDHIPSDDRYQYGIQFDHIYHITEDRQGNIWLGTNNGIFFFNPDPKRSGTVLIRPAPEARNQSLNITGFCELPGGDIVASSWGMGLFFFDGAFNLKKEFRAAEDNYRLCWSLAVDSAHKIWVGCQLGGLMTFDVRGNLLQKINHPAFDNRTIRCMTVAKNGEIWFGTQHGLIIKYDPVRDKYIRFADDGYPQRGRYGHINKIAEDASGRIWATTSLYGLISIHRETGAVESRFSIETPAHPTLSYGHRDLLCFNDSTILVGSENGIDVINTRTKNVRHITAESGLPADLVVNLLKENDQYISFSTNSEIGRMHLPSGKTIVYGARDGILEDSYEEVANLRLRGGRLLIGGNRTIAFIHPEKKINTAPLPPVTITGFKIFNEYLPVDSLLALSAIHLSHHQNFFTVEFASLSYAEKEKTVYYYQLEGVDPDWIRAGNIRFANYTNIDGGHYTFRVKAERADGSAVTGESRINIQISNPYWRSWWFYALAALSITAIVYMVQRIRIQRLLAMETVRKKIARDLHDDMGSTLSTINILSEMARMRIHNDPERTLGFIQNISENSSRMMESMDDIVWSINPVNDSMQHIVARMREFATTVLEPRDIVCSFQIDDKIQHQKLELESRHDFFMIYKEAVNNIAKYARAKNVVTEVYMKKHGLYLRISDDGRGFDPAATEYGNGVANMRKRAQELKGSLVLETAEGKGTCITLTFPVGK